MPGVRPSKMPQMLVRATAQGPAAVGAAMVASVSSCASGVPPVATFHTLHLLLTLGEAATHRLYV
eukprot:9908-Eustigmatos_ZCMA.PRE.1